MVFWEGVETYFFQYQEYNWVKAYCDQKVKYEMAYLLKERYKYRNSSGFGLFSENMFLSNTDSIIEKNLSNSQFSVGQLCKELAMSRSKFYRKIYELTGKSILTYINSYRMLKAMEMTKQGGLKIKEIAFKVGFNDNQYFSRAFKKHFGNCPSYYLPH